METFSIIFPGQGSQKIGMLCDYYEKFNEMQDVFEEASEILKINLWKIVQNNEKILNQTEFTQPILLAASIGIWRVLCRNIDTNKINIMAGHSLGEYAALCAAKSITFSDAIKLVRLRGQLMQNATLTDKYGMSVIMGISSKKIKKICLQTKNIGILEISSFNSNTQTVISGEGGALKKANKLAREIGAKYTKIIPVSIPAHCSLMKQLSKPFSKFLETIKLQNPEIKIIHNCDGKIKASESEIKRALIKQLYQPVQWVKIVDKIIKQHSTDTVIECGPGKILTTLGKNMNRKNRFLDTSKIESLARIFQILKKINRNLNTVKKKTILSIKYVLVTGASSGIGKAIATAFAEQGATVIGTTTSESKILTIKNTLQKYGKNYAVKLNIKSIQEVKSVFTWMDKENILPDIVINNAGVIKDNLIIKLSETDWREVIDTNLTGVFNISKFSAQHMIKQRWGRIINIGSVMGSIGNTGQTNYCASKAGLIGFSKSLAIELAARNITVNVISPGFIETNMTKQLNDETKALIRKKIPLKRLGTSKDISATALFLCSDGAEYITGQVIHVNGGLYMN